MIFLYNITKTHKIVINKPKVFPSRALKILTLNLRPTLLSLSQHFYLFNTQRYTENQFPIRSKSYFTNKNKGSEVVFST